ncbi:MAG: NACHT domain-containing protein, partial [Caldilineaceae bacterium]|nr:NACHT domain-containing protein [Caldilineaceae bacterium]MBP9073592.1 NACHT domain-containing protein [Caldilineaceae bacterium]
MSAVATLTLTVSFAIVKHMVSDWLDGGAKGQVAQDLVDLCKERILDGSGGKSPSKQLDQLAQQVVAGMGPVWEKESRQLDDGTRAAIVLAVGQTVAAAEPNVGTLIQHRLDGDRLAKSMLAQHKTLTTGFSADEQTLYTRLLTEVCGQIVYMANHFAGYTTLFDRHILQTLDDLLRNTGCLLTGPSAQAQAFEQEYRDALPIQLNRFDPIGITYAEDVLRQQRLDLAYVGLRLEQEGSFLRQDAQRFLDRQDMESIQPPVNRVGTIHEMLGLSSRLVIRGQPGSGKSTLLRWLAGRSSRRQLGQDMAGLASWDDTVPFYLRLRAFKSGEIPSPKEWPALNARLLAADVPGGWMQGLLKDGRALVLIDGVDEVSEKHRKTLLESLQTLVQTYPLARYVITSRPAAIKNWPEWIDWSRSAGFETVSLQEMEPEQVYAFVDRWHHALLAGLDREEERTLVRDLPTALKQLLRQRLSLRRLARNPLLCTMICALHRERPNNMPRNRVKLYQDCVEMLLYKRDTEREVGSMADYPPLTHTHEEVVLREYAHHLLLNDDSEEAEAEVDAFFTGLLESINMPDWTGILLRDYFVKRTGLLIEPEDGKIAFAHRTFQEFLAARVIVKKNEISMLLGKARDDQWRETILLTVAIPEISQKQSERLFRGLLKKADKLTTPRSRHELYLLAVACMESPIYLSDDLRREIIDRTSTLIPPRNNDEVALLAKAGDPIVPLLQIDRPYSYAKMARCVDALGEIGSEDALRIIIAYSRSPHYVAEGAYDLRRAIGAAIWNFDPAEYVRRVLTGLQSLDLSSTQVSDAGLVHLAGLTGLQSLNLWQTQVSDAGLVHLAGLTGLQSLYLSSTQVSDAGLVHLAGLTGLQSLYLSSTQVSDAGLVHLAGLTGLQ